jgi:hypothetical protein
MSNHIRCFACLGHGFQASHICGVCEGAGVLDPTRMCSCGRPGIRTVKGKTICWALCCEKRVSEPEMVTYNADDFARQYQGMY